MTRRRALTDEQDKACDHDWVMEDDGESGICRKCKAFGVDSVCLRHYIDVVSNREEYEEST